MPLEMPEKDNTFVLKVSPAPAPHVGSQLEAPARGEGKVPAAGQGEAARLGGPRTKHSCVHRIPALAPEAPEPNASGLVPQWGWSHFLPGRGKLLFHFFPPFPHWSQEAPTPRPAAVMQMLLSPALECGNPLGPIDRGHKGTEGGAGRHPVSLGAARPLLRPHLTGVACPGCRGHGSRLPGRWPCASSEGACEAKSPRRPGSPPPAPPGLPGAPGTNTPSPGLCLPLSLLV